MKETANRGKGKMLLISAGIEIMLIICITAMGCFGCLCGIFRWRADYPEDGCR
ncbi:hypothetical protein IMSAGC012_02420 [Lachnospiraceae bacterium]|jgi:hypothetical protein|nr:hypothetical protein IMSAGC012_02420 [Lachnospiraceae bacterium]